MDGSPDRRAFLEMAAALLCGGLAGCASLATVPVESRGGRLRLVLRNHPRLQAAGGSLRIQPAGHPTHLLVFALGGDEFVTLSPICTHRRCTVDISGSRLVCPCHGSEYTRTGDVLVGPAERPLTRYPTELTGRGELVIRLDGEASS